MEQNMHIERKPSGTDQAQYIIRVVKWYTQKRP
jgi:hypothetical protein